MCYYYKTVQKCIMKLKQHDKSIHPWLTQSINKEKNICNPKTLWLIFNKLQGHLSN